MFDFVRTHSRLMLGLMVLLIFPSFVFFGIQGYSRFTDGAAADAAKVDGRGITRAEWESAHQRQIERMRRQMPGVDAKLFDTPELKRQTLDQLMQEYVLRSAAYQMHLAPSTNGCSACSPPTPTWLVCATPMAASTATCWLRKA